MKTFRTRSIFAASVCVGLALAGVAQAISPLPDTGSGCSGGLNENCFKISTSASNGTAIWGNATNTTGYGIFGSGQEGVRGSAVGSNAIGVHGFGTTFGPGVQGESSQGYGVYGTTSTGSGTAVLGIAGGGQSGSRGVYGIAYTAGIGVYAQLSTGSAAGWALYANGKAGGTTAWNIDSDARLKKNIKDVQYGLQEILKLRPVTYELKDHPEDGTHVGFIAQEVQPIVPEVVHAGSGGMLSLTYTDLIPVMAKAIQEQQKVIQRLERERSPVMTSSFSSGLGGGLALALLPLGIVTALRRRREPRD